MSWQPFETDWHPAALAAWHWLPMRFARRVDAAVIAFAERGDGEIEWVAPHHRLKAGKHDVVLSIDVTSRTLTVIDVYRARP